MANLGCHLDRKGRERTLIEELPPSNWAVSKSSGITSS